MSFLPAISWLGWAALGAVALGIVLLYFLKLRRQRLEVPSTYLWKKSIEDLRVNSLIQRLRVNWLLLLQLLFLGAIGLALLRPGWRTSTTQSRRLVLLIDQSASMQSTDVAPTRLARAKQLARAQISAMSDEQVAMVIAFSDRADVRQGFTDNRRVLLDAIDGIEPTNRSSDIREALQAAAGLANPNRTSQAEDIADLQVADPLPAELQIFSDGRFPPLPEFSLENLVPTFVPIGIERSSNVAITAFSVDPGGPEAASAEAYGRIANLGATPVRGTVELRRAGQLLDAQQFNLAPNEETGMSFAIDGQAADPSPWEFVIDTADDLSLDNRAFASLAPSRQVDVLLVSDGNPPLMLALETPSARSLCRVERMAPKSLSEPAVQERLANGQDRLVIFDRCQPQNAPNSHTWYIDSIPPTNWQRGPSGGPLQVLDLDRTHPLMRFTDVLTLQIAEGTSLTAPAGSIALITSDLGPLLSLATRRGFQDLVLGMAIVANDQQLNTDWPLRRSWPVFVLNVLQQLAGATSAGAAPQISPGASFAVLNASSETIQLRLPDGGSKTIESQPGVGWLINDTEQLGSYTVLDDGQSVIDHFCVNLFDRLESQITPVASLNVGYEPIEGRLSQEAVRTDRWRWGLMAALGVLVVEWFYFANRLRL
jgi:hypothetical protein